MAAYKIDEAYLTDTRRHLHAHPELSQKEYATAAFIRGELERFGIGYRTVGETGTLGRIDGKSPGKTVLLRADIDALPMEEQTGLAYTSQNNGVMHACGHDFHTAALLGAAKVLSEIRDSFDGTVLLAFQQAEEFGHGSKYFVEEGLTRGYDRAFGIHVSPAHPVGTIALTRGADAASCDYFRIIVKGRSAHISKPHLGNSALSAAAELAVQLPKLQSTVLDPLENAVIGIGSLHAGTSWNIIPDEAVLEGTIRTVSHEAQSILTEKITSAVKGIAHLYGTEAEIEWETFSPALINDDDAFEEAYRISAELVGEENVFTDKNLLMGFGADDFAEFIRYEKGVYVHVGAAGEDKNSCVSLHSPYLAPDERALKIMAELHIRYALSVFNEI